MYYAHTRGDTQRPWLQHHDWSVQGLCDGLGIARLIEEEAEVLPTGEGEVVLGDGDTTQDGAVIGTIAHISPEQARGEINRTDGRSDQYVLGLILLNGDPQEGDSKRQGSGMLSVLGIWRLTHISPG